jgi:curved DNA-binding protein CbpA
MTHSRSLYDVLNVSSEAEPVVIDAAYKALMKKYHPDQAPGAPMGRDVCAINEAFAVLKDSAKRAEYDHRLWTRQQAMRLAELQALGRGADPRFVRWGGWLLAALLGFTVVAMASNRNGAGPSTPALAATEAAEGGNAVVRAAALEAAAVEDAKVQAAMPNSASLLARIRAEESLRASSRSARPVAEARDYSRPRRQSRAKQRRPQAARTEQHDFLEREGYIY